MKLEVLLPFRVLTKKSDVLRIVAETEHGSFGLLPRRLDCVAALVPGILSFETQADGEMFIAVDEGVLVKSGPDVRVSVRRAVFGEDLQGLREMVEREFRVQDEEKLALRSILNKLEAGFVSRFANIHRD